MPAAFGILSALAVAAAVVVVDAGALHAQPPQGALGPRLRTDVVWPQAARSTPPPLTVLASAVVPGTGQALGGRWLTAVGFAVVEAAAWWVYLDSRGDGNRLRGEYRDLAWSVARRGPEPRVDGPFEYYERMAHWTRSGAFDADAGTPGVQPERASDAYNGAQWRLAANIYLEGDANASATAQGYASALDFYRQRAYPESLLWDWSGRDPDQIRFARLIEDSDNGFGRASVALGALVANHIVSAIEVYVIHRLAGERLEVDLIPGSAFARGGATLQMRLSTSR